MSKFLPPFEYFLTIFIFTVIVCVTSILTGWHYAVTKYRIDNGYEQRIIELAAEETQRPVKKIWVKTTNEKAHSGV